MPPIVLNIQLLKLLVERPGLLQINVCIAMDAKTVEVVAALDAPVFVEEDRDAFVFITRPNRFKIPLNNSYVDWIFHGPNRGPNLLCKIGHSCGEGVELASCFGTDSRKCSSGSLPPSPCDADHRESNR